MRIPTGGVTVTANASRRYFIGFRCCSCGCEAVMDYFIEEHAQTSYHMLQSKSVRDARSEKAKDMASGRLDALDRKLFEEINEKQVYASIQDKVDCPYCGATQIWSHFPAPWNRSATFPWILGMLLLLVFASVIFFGKGEPGFGGMLLGVFILLAFCAVAALPLVVRLRRNAAQKKIDSAQFEPPVYYDEMNFEKLIARTMRMRHENPNAYVPFEFK